MPFLLILYQKWILSINLIANPTIHENVDGKGDELIGPMIGNTNVFDKVSKYRKTIGEIIPIHEPTISFLSSKIPAHHQYKNTFLIQSHLFRTLFD
jgi:hypothetical protein